MLVIYGVPLSQPCRAIIWACLLKKLPFKLELIIPGNKGKIGSRNPEYLKKNPSGTVPMIEDDGFILWESNAILTYLAQKHGWTDLYPSDLKQRSLVDQYLHWHHRNARESSIRLAAPNFRKDIKFPPGHVEQGKAIIANALKIMDQFWLQSHKFVAGDTLTLADIACYMEFGQLNAKFGNLLDFSPYPKVQQWMTQMESVPFFTEANAANTVIGDMSNGVKPDVIAKANKESMMIIMKALSKL